MKIDFKKEYIKDLDYILNLTLTTHQVGSSDFVKKGIIKSIGWEEDDENIEKYMSIIECFVCANCEYANGIDIFSHKISKNKSTKQFIDNGGFIKAFNDTIKKNKLENIKDKTTILEHIIAKRKVLVFWIGLILSISIIAVNFTTILDFLGYESKSKDLKKTEANQKGKTKEATTYISPEKHNDSLHNSKIQSQTLSN